MLQFAVMALDSVAIIGAQRNVMGKDLRADAVVRFCVVMARSTDYVLSHMKIIVLKESTISVWHKRLCDRWFRVM
jgi:hypothetical protein